LNTPYFKNQITTNTMNIFKKEYFLCLAIFCLCSTINAQEVSTNNWYVGNTKAGEWIKYKQVWLSAGHYRFTTNAVAKSEGQTVCLELNGVILKRNVNVPAHANNEFGLVHLGSKNLPEGYYDVRLVFETGDVNCDMIFIKKSDDTADTVLDKDTEFKINRTDGPHIFAIGGVIDASFSCAKGGEKGDDGMWYVNFKRPTSDNPEMTAALNGRTEEELAYTRHQFMIWNKQEIYAYNSEASDRAMDIYVSEQVEAKVDVVFAHGRTDKDFTSDVEDRSYLKPDGNYGPRRLIKLIDAINRNVYAKGNLKVAHFYDNGAAMASYNGEYPNTDNSKSNKTFDWDAQACREFFWKRSIEPWLDCFYDSGNEDMLFLIDTDKGPSMPIQFWTSNTDVEYKDKMYSGKPGNSGRDIKGFLEYLDAKVVEKFGIHLAFVLSKDFFENDPQLLNGSNISNTAYGKQAWFSWNTDPNRQLMAREELNGKKFGFAFNGGRMPMAERIDNDWNPVTQKGTWLQPSTKGQDFYHCAIDDKGEPKIRSMFEEALNGNYEWVVLESWNDWAEGSTWYRSDHPNDYLFPNQHMALVREFADRESESIVLEAEGCDEYHTTTTGNRGGAYRVNWYQDLDKDVWHSNKEINLSIYRPFHKIGVLVYQGNPSSRTITGFAVGQKDVWAVREDGALHAHQIDGKPANNWTRFFKGDGRNTKKIALGGSYAWMIDDNNKLFRSELETGRSSDQLNGWRSIDRGISSFLDIDLSLKDGWAVDIQGNVYYSDLHGKHPWIQVSGNKLKSICADDQCAWGFTMDTNELVRISSESRQHWDTIPNPHQLTKISAAAGEVWGVNAENKVYRINSSGDGEWQLVFEGFTNVGVGLEYVWLIDTNGDFYNCKISGFETASVFPGQSDAPSALPEIKDNEKNNVNVYPTRFTDKIQIDIIVSHPQEAIITINGINGELVLLQREMLQQGMNTLSITDVASLPQGFYVLSVKTNTINTFKIIKIN
jgi:hypothetical protein